MLHYPDQEVIYWVAEKSEPLPKHH